MGVEIQISEYVPMAWYINPFSTYGSYLFSILFAFTEQDLCTFNKVTKMIFYFLLSLLKKI